jgi:hypothetical protein
MDDDILPSGAPLDKLLADLRAIRDVPSGAHLEEEILIDFACETLPPGDVAHVEEHLATCAQCSDLAANLLDIADGWKGEAGEQRLAMLRQRAYDAGILREPQSPVARAIAHLAKMPAALESLSRTWNARLSGTAMSSSRIQAATGLAGSLRTAPSALYFGGDQRAASADDFGASLISPPKAYAITDLFTANGRTLPEDADIFWAHEVWLIQLPWLIVPRRTDVNYESIGVSVRFPGHPVEIVDVVPRVDLLRTPLKLAGHLVVIDIHWSGRVSLPNDALSLGADVVPLDVDADVRLSTGPTMLGRLSYSAPPANVVAASAGLAEALWVLRPAYGLVGAASTMWMTAITDKHVDRLQMEVRLWIEVKGLNDVPARLPAEPLNLEVTLVRATN